MEVRLLIAFLLMGAVLFVTPYFFKIATPPPGKKTPPDRPPRKPLRRPLPVRTASQPPAATAAA